MHCQTEPQQILRRRIRQLGDVVLDFRTLTAKLCGLLEVAFFSLYSVRYRRATTANTVIRKTSKE
jgi:hypothetical protein